ncbi:hypothetical protein ABEB36_012808 [Hypothenemus hampei]|uniref:Uncharacterized protein n=1 Tax=Hypothenemus hampei TaxID=57062 RepID=A0ABD1E642_HYPHA
MYIPWRQPTDFLNTEIMTWKSVYEQYFNINDNSNYDLDHMLYNLEGEEDFELIDQIETEQPYDWMELAAGPNNIQQEVDLGRREIDITYNWHCISNEQVLNVLQHFINNEKISENNTNQNILNIQCNFSNITFSSEQQELINIFEKQLKYLQENEEEIPIKRLLLKEKPVQGRVL